MLIHVYIYDIYAYKFNCKEKKEKKGLGKMRGSLKWSIMIIATFLFFSLTNGKISIKIYGNTLDQICNQAVDKLSCVQILGEDPRTRIADMKGMALISMSLSIMQATETYDDRIPQFLKKTTDRVGKLRLERCKSDYQEALGKYQEAYKSAGAASYWDVIDRVREGFDKVVHCENLYRTDPIGVCPITNHNHRLINLSGIILIIVDMLLRK